MQPRSSLRSATSKVVGQDFGVLIDGILGKVLSHQVGGIARPQDFRQFKYPAQLLLLKPKYSYVEVTNSADTMSLEYPMPPLHRRAT